MRWEEWRQRKAETFWAIHEAKEREWMLREDPRLKHEAFMQKVLLATEKFEQDLMKAAEREQREVAAWNTNVEAAERAMMQMEDFTSFQARVWQEHNSQDVCEDPFVRLRSGMHFWKLQKHQ
eukprot:g4590.t1